MKITSNNVKYIKYPKKITINTTITNNTNQLSKTNNLKTLLFYQIIDLILIRKNSFI